MYIDIHIHACMHASIHSSIHPSIHACTHTHMYIPTDWDKPPSSKHGGFPQFIWDSTEKEFKT